MSGDRKDHQALCLGQFIKQWSNHLYLVSLTALTLRNVISCYLLWSSKSEIVVGNLSAQRNKTLQLTVLQEFENCLNVKT